MATYARVRANTRRRVRLGKVLVPNTASGALVNLDDPLVQRDMRIKWHLISFVEDQTEGNANMNVHDATGNLAVPTLGVQLYVRVNAARGETISGVTFVSGTTAGNTMTNQVASLYSNDGTTLTKVATSADGTSSAWAGNTAKTFTFTTPYEVTGTNAPYVGLVVAGTTAPTLTGVTLQNAVVAALGGVKAGTHGSGLTNTEASVALGDLTPVATIPFVRTI